MVPLRNVVRCFVTKGGQIKESSSDKKKDGYCNRVGNQSLKLLNLLLFPGHSSSAFRTIQSHESHFSPKSTVRNRDEEEGKY